MPGNALKLLAIGTAFAVVPALSAKAPAQQGSVFGMRSPPPRAPGGGHHGGGHGFGGVWIVEREVPVVVERVVEVPATTPVVPAAPPVEPREPYMLGKRYASLPGGCMKLIEGRASYYYCGDGEWYRPSGRMYLAVAKP